METGASGVRILVLLTRLRYNEFRSELERLAEHVHSKTPSALQSQRDPSRQQHAFQYVPPSVDQLRLALVSETKEMGAWGLAAPLLLEKTLVNSTVSQPEAERRLGGANEQDVSPYYFIASACVPAASVTQLTFCYRLVVVDKLLLHAAALGAGSPSAAIVAVENFRSKPYSIQLQRVDNSCLCAELSGIFGNEVVSGCVPTFLASIEVGDRLLNFGRASTHFPFLSQLSRAVMRGNAQQQEGQLLSLTLYGNDPRVRYDRKKWLYGLPKTQRDAVEYLEKHGYRNEECDSPSDGVLLPTSAVEVCDVYPVPSEGCCWHSGRLPVLESMTQQVRVAKKNALMSKNSNAGSSTSNSPEEAPLCISMMDENVFGEEASASVSAFMHRGWCVEPFHSANPLQTFTHGEPQHTMRVWHTTVNLLFLKGCALLVEAALPVPVYAEPANNNGSEDEKRSAEGKGDEVVDVRWVRGEVVLQPSLFNHTNGTIVLPVCFFSTNTDNKTGLPVTTTCWQNIFIQYLVVNPFKHDQRNTLEIVRSVASHGRLATKKLVGHRGLGKTYTRGLADNFSENVSFASNTSTATRDSDGMPINLPVTKFQRLTVKLAENSLESLNAAHRRGCDMVEFDVMLTRDRVPIIYHDPLIQLQARGKRGAGIRHGRVQRIDPSLGTSPSEFDAGCSLAGTPYCGHSVHSLCSSSKIGTGNQGATGVTHQNTPLHAMLQFTYVPIALHQLTKSQLDVVVTETFTHAKAHNTFRNLVLRHWHKILAIYRKNRHLYERRQCGCKGGDAPVRSVGNDALCERQQSSKVKSSDPVSTSNDVSDALRSSTLPCCDGGSGIERCTASSQIQGRMVSRQEDVTNRICTLEELFRCTPPSLRFDLEVKFPFQPIADANLFLQTDVFEVNAFVDDILRVVFEYGDQRHIVEDANGQKREQGRDVIFSSFEPDICLALKMKQSRYHVVFLCDTGPHNDCKDYRCFGRVEGALQFSVLMNLSGISVCASSLCTAEQLATLNALKLLQKGDQQPQLGTDASGGNDEDTVASHVEPSVHALERHWSNFDCSRGSRIASYAHARAQLVWTWGEMNVDENFRQLQARKMGIDAIITDSVPKMATDFVEQDEGNVST
ncbi:putative Glycerophosphoryl diester phosphodiesterase family [Trypanosoma vivax]|nr:putative Glycerophosphoryl diester phosphodiesterase family [Trypanosoma vivax]